jgi:DNA (cytosine-5)-methyltransferase 1
LAIANIRTKNLGSITQIEKDNLKPCDLLTYSFPCQDLSSASMGKAKGMQKNSGTRSGLL